MLELLWLVPALPFLGSMLLMGLSTYGAGGFRKLAAIIGVGSVAASAVISALIAFEFLSSPPAANAFRQSLWTWIESANLRVEWAYYLDALSLLMMVVITFVAALIHLYSTQFMEDDAGFARFFAYLNLFVASMLALILGDNLLLLYLGWEGVGLCSYLLIGFWYRDPVNGRAARKAFVVTRVGDVSMAIGLFLLFSQFGTLQIQQILREAAAQWPAGSWLAIATTACLLGGALGKSAQLPLQTWLPDAMAGPTPVSALIHAATMVTAGVYLIARTHGLFLLAPPVLAAVGVIGALTLLIAGFTALTQRDLKRILAYSTISQIGYMFLALGVGAWSAAMFHFMTHAFFKALLFLGAGVVILWHHHEHDIFKMGGMRRQLPVVFWTFVAGGASLAALPFVTAGFYSKDLILIEAYRAGGLGTWLWVAGLVGAFFTAIYSFRMVFVAFFGAPGEASPQRRPAHAHTEAHEEHEFRPRTVMLAPLVILAVLAVIGGFGEHRFASFMHSALPAAAAEHEGGSLWLQLLASAISIAGVAVAYALYLPGKQVRIFSQRAYRFFFSGWGFDWLYDRLFVQPFLIAAFGNKNDFIDRIYDGIAWTSRKASLLLRRTQTGELRWYAASIAGGTALLLLITIFYGGAP